MRKKLYTILMIFAFLSVPSLSMIFPVRADTNEASSYDEIWDLEGVSGTANLKGKTFEGLEVDTGNTWTVTVFDDYMGGTFYQDFECVLEGEKANIWIGLAPDEWEGGHQDYFEDYGNGFKDYKRNFSTSWVGTINAGERVTVFFEQMDANSIVICPWSTLMVRRLQ